MVDDEVLGRGEEQMEVQGREETPHTFNRLLRTEHTAAYLQGKFYGLEDCVANIMADTYMLFWLDAFGLERWSRSQRGIYFLGRVFVECYGRRLSLFELAIIAAVVANPHLAVVLLPVGVLTPFFWLYRDYLD